MAPSSLPAGMSFEEFWLQQAFIGTLAINAAVAFGILVWDHVQLLPEERSLYESGRRLEWRTPTPWAFLLLRYGGIASTVASLISSTTNIQNCHAAIAFGHAASICVVAASGILFCSRVAALWEEHTPYIAIVVIPCIVTILTWIPPSIEYKGKTGFDLPFGTNCQFQALSQWTTISYAASSLFTLVVFGMSLFRMSTTGTMVTTNSGFTLINRACLVYLLLVTCGSITLMGVYATKWMDESIKRIAEPYYILLLVAMGSRVFLNLRLHVNILQRVAESNAFTSPNWKPEEEEPQSPNQPAIPTLSLPHEPAFEPSITSLSPSSSMIERRGRSMDALTMLTATAVPPTPGSGNTTLAPSIHSSSKSKHLTTPPGSPPSTATSSRRERQRSFRYFNTHRPLQPDDLKSTWH